MHRGKRPAGAFLIAGLLFTSALLNSTLSVAHAAPAPCAESTALDKALPTYDALVQQICADGSAVQTDPAILVMLPDGTRYPKALAKGNGFSSGTSFSTPAGALVDFITRTGNQIRAFNGATWTVEVTPKGDFINVAAGRLRFFVQHALGAFSVYAAPVFGLVPGTVFDVDLTPGTAVTYSVSEGRVRLTRNVTIHLTSEQRDVDGIRQTDYIVAGGQNTITYRLPLGIFMTFANAAAAEQFFTKQLLDATAVGDQSTIEDSLLNIERVRGPLPPAAFQNSAKEAHSASQPVSAGAHPVGALGGLSPAVTSVVIPVVAAGVVIGAVASASSGSHVTSPISPFKTGTINVSGRARSHPAKAFQFSLGIRL